MKNRLILFSSIFWGAAVLAGCQKHTNPDKMVSMTPIFDTGDTLRNYSGTTYEEIEVTIDSSSNTGFKLISYNTAIPMVSSGYFMSLKFNFQDKIRFLERLADGGHVFKGPLSTTFQHGDTISVHVSSAGIFAWWPEVETQMENTGFIKYHIYSAQQGQNIQNFNTGENYLVFKFGTSPDERLGWINLVYQDSFCYIKEGYFTTDSDQDMVVGVN